MALREQADTAELSVRSRRSVQGGSSASGSTGKSDGALAQALARFAPDLPADRQDTPDHHVTAVRRLPAVSAQYAPFPEGLDARLTSALVSRGISQVYTHQAEIIGHALAGRHTVVITPT